MPLATSRAVATSSRVLGTSARPRSRSCRRRLASLTSAIAVSRVDAALVRDDVGFQLRRRKVELQRDESLPRARLQVLEHVLVARVVGDDELKPGRRLEQLAGLVDRQDAAVVGQRVDHDDGVLARLDDLVEVADGAVRARPASAARPARPSRSRGSGSGR